MKITSEVFDRLRYELYYEKFDHLLLTDTPNQEQLDSIQKGLKRIDREDLINENAFFAFARSERDVCLGSTFNVLFSAENPNKFIETKALLNFISINKGKTSDRLYKGYSGICLFEFKEGVPELLKRLKMYGEKQFTSEYEMLYLSQKPFLDRLLELLKESQA